MKNDQILTTSRMVGIFNEIISCRRMYCADNNFFRMPDFWEDLCDDEGNWTINTYRSNETEDWKRKAGVIAFGDRVTLTTDEKLIARAKQGCGFSNFILAHEMGHVALGHHAKGAVTKHFQLFAGPSGLSNIPRTLEEREANYAAVFLQCGVAVLDPRWNPRQLANRAFSDESSIKKVQAMVHLDVFLRELNRPKPWRARVVL
jgi:hypothetical protein